MGKVVGRGAHRQRAECSECSGLFVVAYEEADAAHPPELTPVVCPHCSELNYLWVAWTVVCSLEYRTLVSRRVRHQCTGCEAPFAIVFEAEVEEPAQMAAVDCPRCGWVNYVSVARSAANTSGTGCRVEELVS